MTANESFLRLLRRRPETVHVLCLRLDLTSSGPYCLRDLWALALTEYIGQVEIGGKRYPLAPDHVLLMSPDVTRTFHLSGPSLHRAVHFRWPRRSFTGPLLLKAPEHAPHMRSDIDEMLSLHPAQQDRTDIRLWDMLWRLVDSQPIPGGTQSARHPALREALRLIETRLSEPLRVADLAGQVGLSHNHLTRLFSRELDTTPLLYIRRRRMQQARHLLLYSNLPVKVIAVQVGIADLQKFNRTAHALWGCSPRALRERHFGPERSGPKR